MKIISQGNTGKPPLSIVLHAYQPPYPFQKKKIVERIVNNTYIPVARILHENDIPVTVNINGSLTEMLQDEFPVVIEELITLHDAGLLEFLGSGCYHPILPLIPDKEVKRQIKLNERVNSDAFGKRYAPKGFFPPELAVSTEIIPLIRSLGYDYIMLPDTATYGVTSKTPYFNINGIMTGVTRDKELSNSLSFKRYNDTNAFISHVRRRQQYYQAPTVLAMDMETYGEHHVNYYNFLVKCLKECTVLKTGDLLSASNEITMLESLKSSSWSTGIDEAEKNNPYPLWDNPTNALHQLQNTHLALINELAGRILDPDDITNPVYKMIAKSQTSCQFWWASSGRFSRELILNGIDLQRQALEELVKYSRNECSSFLLKASDILIERLHKVLDIKAS